MLVPPGPWYRVHHRHTGAVYTGAEPTGNISPDGLTVTGPVWIVVPSGTAYPLDLHDIVSVERVPAGTVQAHLWRLFDRHNRPAAGTVPAVSRELAALDRDDPFDGSLVVQVCPLHPDAELESCDGCAGAALNDPRFVRGGALQVHAWELAGPTAVLTGLVIAPTPADVATAVVDAYRHTCTDPALWTVQVREGSTTFTGVEPITPVVYACDLAGAAVTRITPLFP